MHFCDSGFLSVSMKDETTMAEGSKPCSGSQQWGSLVPAGWACDTENKLRGLIRTGVNSCGDKCSHSLSPTVLNGDPVAR